MKPSDSIRKKIARQTLLMSAVAVFLVFAVAISGIVFLRSSTIEISGILGQTAAADSAEALREQTLQTLQIIADDKAALSDGMLAGVENIVEMAAFNTFLAAGRASTGGTIPFPTQADYGKEMFYLQLPENVSLSDVAEEVGRLSGLEDFYKSVYFNRWGITTLYAGTESGVSITVEQIAGSVTSVFDPRERPWYIIAKESGSEEPVWTDAFDDAFGRGLGIACVKSFYDADGRFLGVVGAGFTLESINEIVLGSKIGKTGYSFILNEAGHIIMSSAAEDSEDGSIWRDDIVENNRLKTTVQNMVSQKSGVELIEADGAEYYIAYTPIPTVSWSFATLISVDEALEMAAESERNIIELKDEALKNIDFWVLTLGLLSAGVFAAVVIITVFMSGHIAKRLTDPITRLTDGAKLIGNGDVEHKFDIRTGDEIQVLAETFERMIADIKRVTAEKERIGAELDVATKIQAGMLPSIFPPFPNREEFDLYAGMQPAKEVGGDFYDFFLVDEDTLAVVMADVSGKGVPAALFMVIAKTLIKNNAQSGKSPKEVFEAVNNILCENNEAGMFVTAFMGYLDIPTGRFTFVNAGHNPPLICRVPEESGKKCFIWLRTQPDFILAGMEDMFYKQHEVLMQPGCELFLYTDGVTEAVNNENELFSDPRLLETVNNNLDLPLREFTVAIRREIDKFAEGAEQADDITMLTLRYKGGQAE